MSDRDVGTHARRACLMESVVAAVAAVLGGLTLAWPDWIERVFGFDPDRHNGAFEVGLVIACAGLAVLLAARARRDWRRAAHALSA